MKKLDSTVVINKPPKVVWAYMDNPDNLAKWLDNFDRYEHVSGKMGEVGSKGKHYYNERGREFVMDEEILEREHPKYLKMSLTSKPMDMLIENYFEEIEGGSSRFRAVADFTRVSAFMRLMMALFQPNKKAQAVHQKQIEKLKDLIEAS